MTFFTSEYECKLDAKGRIVLPAPAGEKPMWLGYVELRRQNATLRLNFWTDFRPELSIQELLAPVLKQVNWELAAGKQARTKGRKGDYDRDLAG